MITTDNKILAWHGKATLKQFAMERLREHRRFDTITQGLYYDYESVRGCHLGCLTHVAKNTHETAERMWGIEQRIGYWLEAVFEGLPASDCAAWVIESTESIAVGADMSQCHHHFGAWLLGESNLLTITDENRDAIERVRRLHEEALTREVTIDERSIVSDAAESAAESARYAVRDAAESAAESAAWSARYTLAESAAESARYAVWSAWYDAESVAWFDAWKEIAKKSIEIFRAAPVVDGICRHD